MTLVHVGRLGRTHGIVGEIGLDRVSLSPEELVAISEFVVRLPKGGTRTLRLVSSRPGGGRLLVRFDGIVDREHASALTGGALMADASLLPDAGPGMAYTFQLVGLNVVDTSGRHLGKIEDVLQTGAHPVYVVRGSRELLIPAVESVVRHIDWDQGIVSVDLPPGLEDL